MHRIAGLRHLDSSACIGNLNHHAQGPQPAQMERPSVLVDEFASIRTRLLRQYRDVFPEELPAGLPPSREVDHKIELTPGSVPQSRPIIRLSASELEELKKQLEGLVKAGFVQPSKSP